MITRRQLCHRFRGLFLLQMVAQEPETLHSQTYPFERLPIHTSGGAQIRQILRGRTATGEPIEVHETTLPAGAAPHPPHHHAHSEMWLVCQGTVEITINGTSHKLEPGSAAFVSSNDVHGIKNRGSDWAKYFVVAVGADA